MLFIISSFNIHAEDDDLKYKIGQMLIVGFEGTRISQESPINRALLNRQIGGVVLFDRNLRNSTNSKNIKNPEQLRLLIDHLQSYAKSVDLPPLFISLDYEGGDVVRLRKEYGFPHIPSAENMCSNDNKYTAYCANIMSSVMRNSGINTNFSPVLDVNVNPDSPAIGARGRSFSSDYKKVTECARIFINEYTKKGIIPVCKHFPGHGSSDGDTHKMLIDVTNTWKDYELAPYENLASGCGMIMVGHIVNKNLDNSGMPCRG
ncbi:MAG: hypothetical protein O7C59_02750 [Rickettsia endosymbiont of Ixodes persulcatus]|nr:hypothetical protein [Rickettsia endosymbiont of Ixodes persulcatus]